MGQTATGSFIKTNDAGGCFGWAVYKLRLARSRMWCLLIMIRFTAEISDEKRVRLADMGIVNSHLKC